MKNRLLALAFFAPAMLFAQVDAPWESTQPGEESVASPKPVKTFKQRQDEFYEYWKDKDHTVKGSGYKVFKRWEEYWETRLLDDGTVPSTMKYWEEYEKMKTSFRSMTS